jgi:hypothetical protein
MIKKEHDIAEIKESVFILVILNGLIKAGSLEKPPGIQLSLINPIKT